MQIKQRQRFKIDNHQQQSKNEKTLQYCKIKHEFIDLWVLAAIPI